MSNNEDKKVDPEENEQKEEKPEINRIKTVNLTVDKEHPKDVYSWFEVTLQDVSVPNQMFQISVEIHLFWQDFTIPALLGKDWKKEAFEVNFDDCPVKMTEVFENKLSHAFENEPKFEYFAETGTIYMHWTSVATFQERLELERFPLDRQFLNMKFNAWVSKGNWNWITAYPDWVPKDFHKPFAVRCTSSVTEYDLLSPWVDFTGDTPLDIRLRVERKPEYYFANIILPNFLIVAGCFSTFVIKPSEVGDRLAITVTLMLAAVAFRFVVSTMLPKVSYLTWMDYYVLVGFIGLVLFIAENAIVGAPGFSEDAKKYIDLVSGVAFAIVWAIMHVVTLLILVNKSWGRIPWNVMDELDRAEDADDEFVYAGLEDIKTNKPNDRSKELWSKYKALSPKDRANLYEKDRKEFLTVPSMSVVVASVDDSNKNSDQDNKQIERVGTFSASSKGGLEANMVNSIELGGKKEVAIVEVSETDKDKETQL